MDWKILPALAVALEIAAAAFYHEDRKAHPVISQTCDAQSGFCLVIKKYHSRTSCQIDNALSHIGCENSERH